MTLLLAELHMLSEADVFSGTFSSNIGRMVVLMRETLHMPRDSAVSCGNDVWYLGRQLRRDDGSLV